MSEKKEKVGIFKKALEFSEAFLDSQILKAKALARKADSYDESNFDFGKAVTRDRGTYIGAQGYEEKTGVLTFEYQKQIAIKSSIIAAIIATYKNKASAYTEYVPQGGKTGFRICLKNEAEALDKIMEELFGESAKGKDRKKITKAETPAQGLEVLDDVASEDIPESPLSEEEKRREAQKELDKRTRARKQELANFLLNCGESENRPFESKKWNFNTFIRALVGDSLTYDQIAVELVPKKAAVLDGRVNIHHFFPVDGSSIRYASPELRNYKDGHQAIAQDFLFPEAQIEALERRDALELDEERLERNEYKYVQVVRGRIERAFTADELKVGMRNPSTDIYANGYAISELEQLVTLVTSHLQTEFYNRSYFQQGFSAKGILHIHANLSRAKLEELRRNWNHMVKGNRNSFQTPILAGMDKVEWIPLTQSHSEMEFSMWLQYLVRMICAIYQIDPAEINYGLKDVGPGGGISGDNTKEKLSHSRNKGFIPLMKFLQNFINREILANLDPEYELKWVGLDDESGAMARILRQKEEVQWLKTVNEVRAEEGLPPIKGADFLQHPVFFQWYSTMSPAGEAFMQKQAEQAMTMGGGVEGLAEVGEPVPVGGENLEGDQRTEENPAQKVKASEQKNAAEVEKSLPLKKARQIKVEVFRLED